MKKLIIIFVVVLSILHSEVKIVIPEQFTKNERMVVMYSSVGCFHSVSNILVFDEKAVTVYETINKKIGTFVLTTNDKKRLNKLLSYYDKDRPKKWCATDYTIKVSHYKWESLLYSKEFFDSSCNLGSNFDVLSFEEIITRASQK